MSAIRYWYSWTRSPVRSAALRSIWRPNSADSYVPLELVPFESAGSVAGAASTGAWTMTFLAIDPARAVEITIRRLTSSSRQSMRCRQPQSCRPSPTSTEQAYASP